MVTVGELLGHFYVVLSVINAVGIEHIQHLLRVVALPQERTVSGSSALINRRVRQEYRVGGFYRCQAKLRNYTIILIQDQSLLEVGLCLLLLKWQMADLCCLLVLGPDCLEGVVQEVVLYQFDLE